MPPPLEGAAWPRGPFIMPLNTSSRPMASPPMFLAALRTALRIPNRGGRGRFQWRSPHWPWSVGFARGVAEPLPCRVFASTCRRRISAPARWCARGNSPRLRQPFVPRRPVTHALALRPAHIGAFLGVAEEPAAAHVIDLGAGIGPDDRVAGTVALHVAGAGRAGRSRSRRRRLSQASGGTPILIPQPRL